MSSGISDTNQAAEQVQIALLRQAGTARRVDRAAEMTSFALNGAFAALRRRYPQANEREIHLLFAEQQYGAELAQRVRTVLAPQVGEHGPSALHAVDGSVARCSSSVLRASIATPRCHSSSALTSMSSFHEMP